MSNNPPDNTVTPPPQGWWADAPKPAVAPASPFFQSSPAPAAASPSEFWKPANALGAGGSAEQARAMAEEMVRTGAMTKEAADAALRAGGNEPAPADTRTDAQKQFDATFAPAAAPAEYRIDYQGRLPSGTETSTVAQFHAEATAWLHELQMPPAIGTATVERAMEIGQRAARMSAPARELYKLEHAAIFDKVAKTPERAAQLRTYAAGVLASAKGSAGFSNGLSQSLAIHDATVLMNLGLHGERLAARAGMK